MKPDPFYSLRPYEEIVDALGGKFAPIQIIGAQYKEARRLDRVRDAAMDALCRNIVERFPRGWAKCDNADGYLLGFEQTELGKTDGRLSVPKGTAPREINSFVQVNKRV